MTASNSASSSAKEVSIRQASSGIRDRSSRQTVTPSPSGSRTSSTATSGRSAGTRAIAWAAVPASPMISMSGSAPRSAATPRRTTSWSSRRKTLMGVVMAKTVPRPPSSPVGGPGVGSWSHLRRRHRGVPFSALWTMIGAPVCLRGTSFVAPENRPGEDRARPVLPQLQLDDLLAELQSRLATVVSTRDRVHALLEAIVSIGGDLDLETVLRSIIEAATTLVDARYGALGVIGEDDRLAQFITAGVTQEQIDALEHWPHGLGILG